ncbi:MAG: YfcE family phosphodiesterase [Firmicutes bacterium]|nr:YfcE family phosphodiesterase [Bacillota bacterium]
MKILVFSDSHGCVGAMQKIAEKEQPDMILHLGDHEYDCDGAFGAVRVVKVRGNCDHGSMEEKERFLDFGKTKILMTHGHFYGVKSGLASLLRRGEELGATLILFGHTHRRYLWQNQEYSVMNPGTPLDGYGVIEMEGDAIVSLRLEDAGQ